MRPAAGDEMFFLVPQDLVSEAEEAAVAYIPFEPLVKEGEFTVTPLLTPDNYLAATVDLIKSAENLLYIQNQTFNAPGENDEALHQIIDAVLERQDAGVEVKVIFRSFYAPDDRQNVEDLISMGFKAENIKLQKNCHTKGIIVDDKKIMLGSQNLSNLGVSTNRDASLVFEDVEMVAYFTKIFLHDWNKRAKYSIGNESVSAALVNTPELQPAGMERFTLEDIENRL
jgi:phosphatidylserine/phosphatidylglycerophosphate/cardiolipin synthase-like enzyme